jgi:hypothetical protein
MGQASRTEGVGMEFPEREADCTGQRPAWYPFQINVCDDDAPDPVPLTAREMSIGDAKPIPWWPFD